MAAMGTGSDTLDCVAAALVAAGVGQQAVSAIAWMIYIGAMQDDEPGGTAFNDAAICLYETPGLVPEEGLALDYPAVQVRVRTTPDGYTAGRQKMQDVYDALHANETPIKTGASTPFVYFYAQQSAPIGMGMDVRRRHSFVWNFRSMRNRPV